MVERRRDFRTKILIHDPQPSTSAMTMNKRSASRFPIYVLIGLAALLSSCASRPESGFLAPIASSERGGADNSILIATTRERDARPGTFFNGERSAALDFAAVTVSVPPVP